MNDEVEEVKSKTDIVSLISEYIELKRAGRNYKALCPFHSEKTPSFIVSPELQIFKCFSCAESGDAFSFVEKHEGMEFYEALKLLAQKAGVILKPSKFDQGGMKEKIYKINSYAAYFYSYILLKHEAGKPALNYLLKERRLTMDSIKTFALGFSPDTSFALKSFLVDKKQIKPAEIEKAGIIYRRDGGGEVDRFRGRIIFPLFDHRGNNVGFSGRLLPSNKNTEMAKYINSPETETYHKSKVLYGLNLTRAEIKKQKEAIIVEGELDVISSYQVGIRNTVAIKGSALTSDQAKLLSRVTPKITLALDADFAGNEAARRGLEILEEEGLEVKVATLTGFKDPDEAAHKEPDRLKLALKDSKLVWDFVLDSIFTKHKGEAQTANVSREAVPFLASIKDEIVRAHYTNQVAQRLRVPFDAVASEMRKFHDRKKEQVPVDFISQNKPGKKTRRELLEERLLAIIFKKDPNLLTDKKFDGLLKSPIAKKIRDEFLVFALSNKTFDPKTFSAKLPAELAPAFLEITLAQIDGLDDESEQAVNREIELVKKELNILKIKDKLEQLSDEIKKSELGEDNKTLKASQEKFGILSQKLNILVDQEIKGIIS